VLRSNLLSSLSNQILASVVFPIQVDMFLQRDHSAGQPMGGYTDSYQPALLQGIYLAGQSGDVREFDRSRIFGPSPLVLGESTYEGGEAGFMVLTIEPSPVPPSKKILHWEVKKAALRASLETHTPDNLSVSGTRLIF
jgi:hypothetical protein